MADQHTATIPSYIHEWFTSLPARELAAEIDPATTAVFSADMINGFCHFGALASDRVNALIGPVVDLFTRAHALGVREFVLMQDTHEPDAPEFAAWPSHCVRGTPESETIPELAALPFANLFMVVEKNSLHPGHETGFDAWLAAHPEVRTALVVGDCTDLCVYQLAMHLRVVANARNTPDVRVIVPANAVDTYDLSPEAAAAIGAFPHPAQFFHEVFLYHMALNGIEVVRELG
ncbi:MAG: isochorismatase family cysteine hydrolase [Thermomicrobiales bacterium]